MTCARLASCADEQQHEHADHYCANSLFHPNESRVDLVSSVDDDIEIRRSLAGQSRHPQPAPRRPCRVRSRKRSSEQRGAESRRDSSSIPQRAPRCRAPPIPSTPLQRRTTTTTPTTTHPSHSFPRYHRLRFFFFGQAGRATSLSAGGEQRSSTLRSSGFAGHHPPLTAAVGHDTLLYYLRLLQWATGTIMRATARY